jgi:acyl dehydratase
MSYGRYFEEFSVGQLFKHWPGRTIGEADCTWFALLTMNQHPLHSDAHYAETHTQHKQRVVLGPLVFSVVIGMTVADVSGRAIANLEVDRLVHEKPTFIGDTLYARSTVLALRESKRGDRGHRDRRDHCHQPARRPGVLLYAPRARAEEEPSHAGRGQAALLT